MSKRFGGVLRISLSRKGITLLRTGGWWRTRCEVLAESTDEDYSSVDVMAAKLRSLLEDAHCARMPVRVVLSDSLVRRWMVVPPQNATRLADCAAAAAARYQALFGEALTDWQLAADWDTRRPFLACAIPEALLTMLRQVASEYRLVLLEVAPQFVVAWNRWRTRLGGNAWFGTLYENALTVAVPSRHGLAEIREVSLPDGLAQNVLPQIVAREALRLNVAMPAEIRLCGQIPAHWGMHAIDKLTFTRLDRLGPDQALPKSAGVSLALTGMRS